MGLMSRGEGNRQALRTQGDYVLLGLGVTGLEDKDPTFQPRGMGSVRSRWAGEADGALCKGSSPHARSLWRGRSPLCRCWGSGKVVNYKTQLQHKPGERGAESCGGGRGQKPCKDAFLEGPEPVTSEAYGSAATTAFRKPRIPLVSAGPRRVGEG